MRIPGFLRLCLLILPPRFRRRWGEALLLEYTSRRAGAGVVHFWATTLGDLVATALREWRALAFGGDHLLGGGRRSQRGAGGRRGRSDRAMSTLHDELRQALRALIRQPSFVAVAMCTLALGIGANTAIFSVVHGVLLQPLPYQQPSSLVAIWPGRTFSKELLERLRSESTTLAQVEAYSGWTVTLTGDGSPEELVAVATSGGLLEMLGAQVELGRSLTAADSAPGAEPVTVLADGLWRRRYGADPEVVGRVIELSATEDGPPRRRVVGILAPGHHALFEDAEVWFPLEIDPANAEDFSGSWYLSAVGRVAPDSSRTEASAEISRLARLWRGSGFSHFDEEELARARVEPLRDWLVGSVRSPLLVLLVAVGLLLLVACANVANLVLVRASGRQRELAVRAALGASRGRLVRQLQLECLLLAALGGAVGTAIAWAVTTVVRRSLADSLPRAAEVGLDSQVLVFGVALSLLASALCGLAPALRATGRRSARVLGETRAALPSHSQGRLQLGLVLTEVALATVLVVGAGLLLKSFWRLVQVEPGFRTDGVTSMAISPPASRYPEEGGGWSRYFDSLEERLRAVPGVDSVGSIHLQLLTFGNWRFPYEDDDHPVPPDTPPADANYRVVTAGYFRTLGVPLLEGRTFGAGDRRDAPRVVVLNRTMARQLWPDESPIGKEIRLFRSVPYHVIGVVGDVHQASLDRPAEPEMYYHLPQQRPTGRMFVMVHASRPPAELLPELRDAVWSIDADVPIGEVAGMDEVVGASVARARLVASLLGVFAVLALVLGAVGVYGVMSYVAGSRRREIGVRLALGAGRTAVLRATMAEGLRWAGAGLLLGLVAAVLAGNLLGTLLFDTRARDPAVLVAVVAVLASVAALACYLPARRAAGLDPMVSLRHD